MKREFIIENKLELRKETFYHNNGEIEVVRYYLGNKHHREIGPAIINYSHDGRIIIEGYYYNDELHRENGPAVITYNRDGDVVSLKYYLNGKHITNEFQILIMKGLSI